jgi:hypothetical protein
MTTEDPGVSAHERPVMQHTPGPWAMGRHGSIVGGPDFEFARGPGRKQIAMACVVPEGVDGTQEGNARLIADAPCLLSAVIKLRAEFNGLPRSLGYGVTHLPEVDALLARLGICAADDGLPVGAVRNAGDVCQPLGLWFDAFGEKRQRYVRVSLDGNHCVMHPSEGDTYLKDARDCGDDSQYTVADVYLSEREFEDLPEHDGF